MILDFYSLILLFYGKSFGVFKNFSGSSLQNSDSFFEKMDEVSIA